MINDDKTNKTELNMHALDMDDLEKVTGGGGEVSYEITADMIGDNNTYTDDNGHTWIGVEKIF